MGESSFKRLGMYAQPETALDHVHDFGLQQSKIMNVIDSNNLERAAGGKLVPTFPQPALVSWITSVKEGAISRASLLRVERDSWD